MLWVMKTVYLQVLLLIITSFKKVFIDIPCLTTQQFEILEKRSPENYHPGKLFHGKIPPVKFFCEVFLISNFHFYGNFLPQLKYTLIQFIFLLQITICLLYIFHCFFPVHTFLIFSYCTSFLSYIDVWSTMLGIATWLVRRIAEKFPPS